MVWRRQAGRQADVTALCHVLSAAVFWARHSWIRSALLLPATATSQDLAAGYMSGKLLLKLDAIAFLLTHHTSGAPEAADSGAARRRGRAAAGACMGAAAWPPACSGFAFRSSDPGTLPSHCALPHPPSSARRLLPLPVRPRQPLAFTPPFWLTVPFPPCTPVPARRLLPLPVRPRQPAQPHHLLPHPGPPARHGGHPRALQVVRGAAAAGGQRGWASGLPVRATWAGHKLASLGPHMYASCTCEQHAVPSSLTTFENIPGPTRPHAVAAGAGGASGGLVQRHQRGRAAQRRAQGDGGGAVPRPARHRHRHQLAAHLRWAGLGAWLRLGWCLGRRPRWQLHSSPRTAWAASEVPVLAGAGCGGGCIRPQADVPTCCCSQACCLTGSTRPTSPPSSPAWRPGRVRAGSGGGSDGCRSWQGWAASCQLSGGGASWQAGRRPSH